MEIDVRRVKTGVAVSGGVDSMVLLRLFMDSGADFCVINVEHGIRGESSVKDSEFVANFCKNHGIECYVERVNALEYAEKHKISVELAARELRYAVFEKYLADGTVKAIALAHHADDNAETVLMRLFRGTGVKGLKGIVERDNYIRPLLKYTREDILSYARENGVEYVDDETNADSAYTRNFIRNELLPVIKEKYPAVVESIYRLSKNAEEIDAFLEKSLIKPEKTADGYVLRNLFDADVAIQKYSMNAVLRTLGAVKDVEDVHLTALLNLKDKDNNVTLDMPFGITALKYDKSLCFFKETKEEFVERPFSPKDKYVFGGFTYRFTEADCMSPRLTFDGDKAIDCVVRTRRDGDKFCRVNGKNKLLSDFLNEKKLLKSQKDKLLLLVKGDVVYAVLGLEIAEEVKIDENTKKIIYIVKENETYDER